MPFMNTIICAFLYYLLIRSEKKENFDKNQIEIMQPAVVIIYDDSHRSKTQDCKEKYLEFLAETEGTCHNINDSKCVYLCKECDKQNKNVIKIKNLCPKEISLYASSYIEQGVQNFCKRCADKDKYNKNFSYGNEKNASIKSDIDNVYEKNGISKVITVSEVEQLNKKPHMENVTSELKDPESIDSPRRKEICTTKNEGRSENKISCDKQQEIMNSANFNMHKVETYSSIINEYPVTPVKTQTAPESLSFPDDLSDVILTTIEKAQSLQTIYILETNSDNTQKESPSSDNTVQGIIQVPQVNPQDIDRNKGCNAKEPPKLLVAYLVHLKIMIVHLMIKKFPKVRILLVMNIFLLAPICF
ncbi:variable surface protein [Plasmodium gonderi]|uniref:Variable surface protein n=1 Tax=Plasmodium gonderi TaxID=77519 RepID=A0A1Y1JPS3_PLAGO|nr:variable surface protein [Plasmodium gonderi]GAW84449.1 variable surface protein [Plasmodium gonderi]